MPLWINDVIVKQAEAEKACSTGFDANCPENVSRGILWPKRVGSRLKYALKSYDMSHPL